MQYIVLNNLNFFLIIAFKTFFLVFLVNLFVNSIMEHYFYD